MAEKTTDGLQEQSESSKTKLCCHNHSECAYFTSDRAKVIHKWTFLGVIGTLLLIAVFYFAYSNYVYKSSFKSIIDGHKTYVTNLENTHYVPLENINTDSITADSKVIINAIVKEQQALTQIHKEEAASLDSLLEMHSQRMSDDFANLTLWASVLMIEFLVFSIYAMYKMDEMQNRGGESLSKIYDAYNRVMSEIKNIRKIQSDLEKNYSNQITSLQERSGAMLEKLKADISAITQAANNSIQSFNSETAKLQSNLDDKIITKVNNAVATLEQRMGSQETNIGTLMDQIKNYENLAPAVRKLQDTVNKIEAAQVLTGLNAASTPTQTNVSNENQTKSDISHENGNEVSEDSENTKRDGASV